MSETPIKQFPPPESPGVYLMKDTSGTIIYVGKAKDLKKRVSSYFVNKAHDVKTLAMVEKVVSIEYILTHNETEALILESNLIKKFKARYNIDLKDSYRYPFVRITDEPFPRLEVIRSAKEQIKDSKNVFGPFVDGSARKRMIQLVEKHFKLRTCDPLPKKACLKFYISQCSAPCIGNISREEYAKSVERAKKFFKGERKELIEELETEMKNFSNQKLFELALDRRNALSDLQHQNEKQVIEKFKVVNEDYLGVVKGPTKVIITALQFRHGTLMGKKEFTFDTPLVNTDIVEDFILNYYNTAPFPQKINLAVALEDPGEMEAELSRRAGHPVAIVVPQKGEGKRILDMAVKNAQFKLEGIGTASSELKEILHLPEAPKRIECFDISHLGGSEVVASQSSFYDEKPDKANYKRFKVSIDTNDDFAAMNEVVKRKFSHPFDGKWPKPDLVIIDGGKGQLGAAIAAMKEMDVHVPVVALAKREEEIFIAARPNPIKLDLKTSKGLRLLTAVRDEAHRFAVTYQRKRREMQFKRNNV